MKVGTHGQLRVFISSTMNEFVHERAAIKLSLEAIYLQPILAEDLGATGLTPREGTQELVRSSDIYVGIFGREYGYIGSGGLSATEIEYQEARRINLPILIYVRDLENRHPQLTRFLATVENYDRGHMRKLFSSSEDLVSFVKRDVMQEVINLAKLRNNGQLPPPVVPQVDIKSMSNLSGVTRVLQDQIIRRAKQQLSTKVKIFHDFQIVEQGLDKLAENISVSNAIPDCFLGWKNDEIPYLGSEYVTHGLAKRLDRPAFIMIVSEFGEQREIRNAKIDLGGAKDVIICDDAAYSGSTLRTLALGIRNIFPELKVGFAVLTYKLGAAIDPIYYVETHETDELLFPWGWSRHIAGLYDIFELFGIDDRRMVVAESATWGVKETFAGKFLGAVQILRIFSNSDLYMNQRELDLFLYVVAGVVSIKIDDTEGLFFERQYIFIPRGVPFHIRTVDNAIIVELTCGPIAALSEFKPESF